jgi:DNA (cytosine-5)-methyltransferase 1
LYVTIGLGTLPLVHTVVDLFSGAGGMSCGFSAHPRFRVIAAVDAQRGKPTSPSIECNRTYAANIGIEPRDADLMTLDPRTLDKPTVLISCAPCTGFSRTLNVNHAVDDRRNSLVVRSAEFVEALRPEIFLMENARELLSGNFSHHAATLRARLESLGYTVHAGVHRLDRYGLPQVRERALIIATRRRLRTLDELWDGFALNRRATHVRRALSKIAASDPMHVSPNLSPPVRERLSLIPRDGGSWADLRHTREGRAAMTPAMRRYLAADDLGSHPDVYGRLAWDRPAPTIKRECSHVGNGRYSHPEEDRLCTVRELGNLQGFPRDYRFVAGALSNMYRHIGDAVPPLISYQLAALCTWMLDGKKPRDFVLPNASLRASDLTASRRSASTHA